MTRIACKIEPHVIDNDWCHLCGRRSSDTADVWYTLKSERNEMVREHAEPKTEYIRICLACGVAIVRAAKARNHKSELT